MAVCRSSVEGHVPVLSLDCIVTGAMVPRLYATCSSAALRSKIETAEVVIFEMCLDLVCWFADLYNIWMLMPANPYF